MALSGAKFQLYSSTLASTLHDVVLGQHVTIYTLHRPAISERLSGGTPPQFLDDALALLTHAGFQFVSIEEICNAITTGQGLPKKSVCFSVDDGYADQAEYFAPLFIKHNVKPTFFLITDLLDGKDWPWDEKIPHIIHHTSIKQIAQLDGFSLPQPLPLSTASEKSFAIHSLQNLGKTFPASDIASFVDAIARTCEFPISTTPPDDCKPMSWDTVRTLEAQGIRFGPHSMNHYITSKLTPAEAEQQFTHAWLRLRQELNDPARIYCYPTGRAEDFSLDNQHALKNHGFDAAVSMVSEPLRLKHGKALQYTLPRIAFPSTMNDVLRYASWFESARSLLP